MKWGVRIVEGKTTNDMSTFRLFIEMAILSNVKQGLK